MKRKHINFAILLFLIITLTGVFLNLRKDIKELKSDLAKEQQVIDSISSENFVLSIQLQRHEVIYDMLDSVCQVKYDSVLQYTE